MKTTRRQFLTGLAAGALLAAPLPFLHQRRSVRAQAQADDRPNIVLITVDALRADHLSCYGYPESTSPHIDRLAAEGVLFRNAVSTAPWTFPSFSAMHTSMYPSELGISARGALLPQIYTQRLDPLRTTLAEQLQAQGYRTQAVVTNPWLFPEFGFGQGFDGYTVVDRQRAHDYDAILRQTLAGRFLGTDAMLDQLMSSLYGALMGPSGQPVWDVRADRVTDSALDWLDGHHQERFFLWLHYIDPHYPFSPPDVYRPRIAGIDAARMDYLGSYNEEDVYTARARLSPLEREAIVSLYDGEIRYVDHHIGRFLSRMDELNLRDNTFLMLSADHGEEFWDHGGFQHGHTLYNELLHIPLIVRPPRGLAEGRVVDTVVRHVDIAPTLTEVGGTAMHADAHGLSLSALLAGDAHEDRTAFSEALFLASEKKAIRRGHQKLILDQASGMSELYDLSVDPLEYNNVAAQEVALMQSLKTEMTAWLNAADAQYAALPRSIQGTADQALTNALRAGGY